MNFMTAQSHKVGEHKALNASGIMPNPFNPMTLASTLWQMPEDRP